MRRVIRLHSIVLQSLRTLPSTPTFRLAASWPGRAIALVLAVLATAGSTPPAHADERSEIDRLVESGQRVEALARLDRLVAQHPRDPQLRFQRGVLLAESERSAEAIEVFGRLAADYPEIPETHNNLAVLHAAAGDFDKASAALGAALRANPNYAVAHQNMGDIHAQLARRSYERALQLDPANPDVPARLALLRQLAQPAAASASRPVP